MFMNILMTPYMLNTIDFTMAGIINNPKFENGKLEILCGGMTLLSKNFFSDEIGKQSVFTDYSSDMYLSGIGKFTFVDILSYSINYYNDLGLINGMTLRLCNNEAAESYIVAVFNNLDFYNGKIPTTESIDVIVNSTNLFEFSFDDNSLVDVREYCQSPQKYVWYNNIK